MSNDRKLSKGRVEGNASKGPKRPGSKVLENAAKNGGQEGIRGRKETEILEGKSTLVGELTMSPPDHYGDVLVPASEHNWMHGFDKSAYNGLGTDTDTDTDTYFDTGPDLDAGTDADGGLEINCEGELMLDFTNSLWRDQEGNKILVRNPENIPPEKIGINSKGERCLILPSHHMPRINWSNMLPKKDNKKK